MAAAAAARVPVGVEAAAVAAAGRAHVFDDGRAHVFDDGRALARDVAAEEVATLRGTELFFSSMLGEFGVFLAALALGVLVAFTAPYVLDFFLATCRVPRNRRYQLNMLVTGLLLFLALYFAFALVGIPFGTVLIASSIFSLPITYALQPLLVQYFAGFWLQMTTIFEEHHRVRINERDIVIIALGTLAIEGREYFDASAQHGATVDVERGERPGARPDAGVDEAGVGYADKTVFIPNDVVLNSVVTAWWRNPRTYEDEDLGGAKAAVASARTMQRRRTFAVTSAAATLTPSGGGGAPRYRAPLQRKDA